MSEERSIPPAGALRRSRRAAKRLRGLYADCLDEDERALLAQALASASGGLEEELAVARVLIRRAIIDGRPAREVTALLNCLAGLLKTQHVLSGHNAKQLDEALAAALDAISVELGVSL